MAVSPVLRALARAKLDAQVVEWERAEAAMEAALSRRLGVRPSIEQSPQAERDFISFRTWCEANGVRHCPARPAVIAQFVLDHAVAGMEMLLDIVTAVSEAHSKQGFANPTATWMVAAALRRAGDVAPPRSWPKALKDRFSELPLPLKQYVAKHDAERERVLRRAQNEAARARRSSLADMPRAEQKPGETNDRSDAQ